MFIVQLRCEDAGCTTNIITFSTDKQPVLGDNDYKYVCPSCHDYVKFLSVTNVSLQQEFPDGPPLSVYEELSLVTKAVEV